MAFHMYVYGLALVFLVYFEVCLRKFKYLKKKKEVVIASTSMEHIPSTKNKEQKVLEQESYVNTGFVDSENIQYQANGNDHAHQIHVMDERREEVSEKKAFSCEEIRQIMPELQFTGEGFNLFARLGLIAFGFGAVLLDGFRLLMLYEDPKVYDCYGSLSLTVLIVRAVFTFFQIFCLFKNHKVIINYRHALMKFGLMHVVVANMCTWIMTLALEAQSALSHTSSKENQTTPHNINETSFLKNGDLNKDLFGGKKTLIGNCLREGTLYDKASPYLYPFVIEFSLLAAALFFKLFSTIGTTLVEDEKHEGNKITTPSFTKQQCHKSNTGLFFGLGTFITVLIAMCFFIYLMNKDGSSPRTIALFHLCGDLSTNSLSLLVVIIAFYKISKLKFAGNLEDAMDQNLLIVALFGTYLLIGFIGYAASFQLFYGEYKGTVSSVTLVTTVMSFLQTTIQVIFIIDALRRKVDTKEDIENKPGRSSIIFLVCSNLAMWMINSFQLKEIYHHPLYTQVYGKLAWTLIMHILLPVAAFFRFHASVCLADIWLNTYSQHNIHTANILKIIDKKEKESEKTVQHEF